MFSRFCFYCLWVSALFGQSGGYKRDGQILGDGQMRETQVRDVKLTTNQYKVKKEQNGTEQSRRPGGSFSFLSLSLQPGRSRPSHTASWGHRRCEVWEPSPLPQSRKPTCPNWLSCCSKVLTGEATVQGFSHFFAVLSPPVKNHQLWHPGDQKSVLKHESYFWVISHILLKIL